MGTERLKPRPFAVEVRHAARSDRQATAILDLHGEVDGFASPALQEYFDKAAGEVAAEGRQGRVALNFSDVDYINSTGIALLVGLLAQARRRSLPLVSYGLNEHYTEIFRITQLSDFMTIVDDEPAALALQGD